MADLKQLEHIVTTHQHRGDDNTSPLRFLDLQQIGAVMPVSTVKSMSVSIPPKKFLRVYIQWGAKSGASDDYVRFNGDSGNNYTTTTGQSQAQIDIRNGANSALGGFSVIEVVNNISSQVKPVFIHTVNRITSAGTAISSYQLFACWVNTTAFINTISLTSSNSETYPSGSSIIVLGSR